MYPELTDEEIDAIVLLIRSGWLRPDLTLERTLAKPARPDLTSPVPPTERLS